MIKHHFKIAIRALLKYKTYSVINLFGLTLGIALCLLIYQYAQFELSYDRFHRNSDNIYRVKLDYFTNESLNSSEVTTTHGLGQAALESIPEIENLVRIRPMLKDEGAVIKNPENRSS